MAGMRIRSACSNKSAMFTTLTLMSVYIVYLAFWEPLALQSSRKSFLRSNSIMSHPSRAPHRQSPETPSLSAIKIAACTCVRNDVPYLLEWIEFHRLQGFSKFFIFDDRSDDNVTLLQNFYNCKFPGQSVVEVFPHQSPGYQPPAYKKCQDLAVAGKFDWVAVLDSDEFWYSPSFGTVSQFVEARCDASVGAVEVTQMRFGTSGQLHRFSYSITSDSNRVVLSNPNGIQLITRTHIRRGPYSFMAEPAELISNSITNCSKPAKDGWLMCYTPILDRKSMWRPDAPTGDITPHFPNSIHAKYTTLRPSVNDLRGNHYYYRSVEDAVKKSIDWKKPDPLEGVFSVGEYWNTIEDVGITRFVGDLEIAVGNLLK